MSDYLTRLVERATGKTLGVRPVTPPLFASGPNMTFSDSREKHRERTEESSTLSVTEPRPAEERATIGRMNSSHSDAVRKVLETKDQNPVGLTALTLPTVPSDDQDSIQSESHVARPVNRAAIPLSAPELLIADKGEKEKKISPQAVISATQASLENTPEIVTEGIEPSVTQMSPNSMNIFNHVRRFVQQREQRFDDNLLIRQPSESPDSSTRRRLSGVSAGVDATVSDRSFSEIIHPQFVRPRHQQILGSENTVVLPPNAHSMSPTIKVSIGRIDVRAIVPPTPAAKSSASSTPKLSLDDYLKKQSGGKR